MELSVLLVEPSEIVEAKTVESTTMDVLWTGEITPVLPEPVKRTCETSGVTCLEETVGEILGKTVYGQVGAEDTEEFMLLFVEQEVEIGGGEWEWLGGWVWLGSGVCEWLGEWIWPRLGGASGGDRKGAWLRGFSTFLLLMVSEKNSKLILDKNSKFLYIAEDQN